MTFEDAIIALRRLCDDPATTTVPVAELYRAIGVSWPQDFRHILKRPTDLTGRPSSRCPRDYHLAALAAAIGPDGTGDRSPAGRARVQYHARWLLFLGAPGIDTLPEVSLVIPIYNRAWMIDSLLQNCFRQTHPKTEIVVVDDGSTDDTAARIAAYGDRIKFVSQRNTGVSGARNAGIAAASGHLVHFLDSDNLLHPDHLKAKVQAFAAIPDASLCYCRATEVAIFGTSPRASMERHFVVDEGSPSPTAGLLDFTTTRGFPFLVTAVTLPRFLLLCHAPAFDVDLKRGEDARFWFRLSLDDAKAIRLSRSLFYRVRMKDGLNESRVLDDSPDVIVRLRDLRDLLAKPDHWPRAGAFVSSGRFATAVANLGGARGEECRKEFDHVARAVSQLPLIGSGSGRSPLPLLLLLKSLCTYQMAKAPSRAVEWKRLAGVILDAIEVSPAIGQADLDAWSERSEALAAADLFGRLAQARVRAFSGQKGKQVAAAITLLRAIPVSSKGQWRKARPLVTVTVPVLDDPAGAEKTLASLLVQPLLLGTEILVVDPEPLRLERWRQLHPRVSAVVGSGLAEAYGMGLGTAPGRARYLRFLRPGDELARGALARQLVAAFRHRGSVVVESADKRHGKVRNFEELAGSNIPLSHMLFPKAVFSRLGGFDLVLDNAFEDRFRWRLAASRIKCVVTPERTEWSKSTLAVGPRGMVLAAAGNLVDCLRSPALWKYIPCVTQPLVDAAGTVLRGTLVGRMLETASHEIAGLAVPSSPSSPLPALVLCLIALNRNGTALHNGLAGLQAAARQAAVRLVPDAASDQRLLELAFPHRGESWFREATERLMRTGDPQENAVLKRVLATLLD